MQLLEEVGLRESYEQVVWSYFENVVAKAAIQFQVNFLEESACTTTSINLSLPIRHPSSWVELEDMLLACVKDKSVSEVSKYNIHLN